MEDSESPKKPGAVKRKIGIGIVLLSVILPVPLWTLKSVVFPSLESFVLFHLLLLLLTFMSFGIFIGSIIWGVGVRKAVKADIKISLIEKSALTILFITGTLSTGFSFINVWLSLFKFWVNT